MQTYRVRSKYQGWFDVVLMVPKGGGGRMVGSIEGSLATQTHFNSVVRVHALRQKVDFCNV